MKKTILGTIAGAVLGGGAVFGATLEPTPVLSTKEVAWTFAPTTQQQAQAYVDIANAIGVTLADKTTDNNGNLQLVIKEKTAGSLCQ